MRILTTLIFLTGLTTSVSFAQLNLTTSVIPPSCTPGCDGEIIGNITGGMPPYSITSTPNISFTQGTNSFTANNVCQGSYTITVTDAVNVSFSATLNVTQTSPVLLSMASSVNSTCWGLCNGSITVAASGGNAPYLFSILPSAPPSPGNTFNNLCAGAYTLTATDGNGCTATLVNSIFSPSALSVNTNVMNQNPCDPDTLDISSFGGTSPYFYSLTNLPPGITQIGPGLYSNLATGCYTAMVTDANNCTASSLVCITNNSIPSVTGIQSIPPDCNQSNGSVNFQVNNNGFTGDYVLNPGNITQNIPNFSNLSQGSYTLSINVPGCNTILDSITLNGRLNPYPMSFGGHSFNATVPVGGNVPYTYTLNSNVLSAPSAQYQCGTKQFTITDAGSCIFDTTFQFIPSDSLPGLILNKNITNPTCLLTNDGSIVYAPNQVLNFNWFTLPNSNAMNQLSISGGTYIAEIINGNNECMHDTSVLVNGSGNCGSVSGLAFLDTLINCQWDSSEIRMSNVLVTLSPYNISQYTNASGVFQFDGVPLGNYQIIVDTNFLTYHYPSCGTVFSDSLSTGNPSDTIQLPHYAFANSGDPRILMYNSSILPASPTLSSGRRFDVYYGISNAWTMPYDFDLYVVLDSITHYDTSSIAPALILGDTLIWSFSNYYPVTNYSYDHFSIYLDNIQNLPVNYQMPVKAWIKLNQVYIQNQLFNDTAYTFHPFSVSWDPNDKAVSPEGVGSNGYIDEKDTILTYRIRFQNTGNAMAFNISVEDTLSPYLNPESVEVLNASHDYFLERDGNLLRFKFPNIMLPDSSSDESHSHGTILYQVHRKDNNIIGDVIQNTASIYFDYNPAVMTNTTINTIGIPNAVEEIAVAGKEFSLYPIPNEGILYIQSLGNWDIQVLELLDLNGRRIPIDYHLVREDLYKAVFARQASGNYILKINNRGTFIQLR